MDNAFCQLLGNASHVLHNSVVVLTKLMSRSSGGCTVFDELLTLAACTVDCDCKSQSRNICKTNISVLLTQSKKVM